MEENCNSYAVIQLLGVGKMEEQIRAVRNAKIDEMNAMKNQGV